MAGAMESLSSAISIVRRMREVNEKTKNVEFASLIADLNYEFAELKLKFAGVMEENLKLKERIRVLESVEGDPCPRCRKRTYQLESSKPDSLFGDLGGTRRTYKCVECGFTEQNLITPNR
jgi:rubrerythrin